MCAKEFEVPKVDNSSRNICGICGALPKYLLKTVCCHQFCNICIKNWIKHNHNSCPKCRFQFQILEKSNNFTDFMVSESIVFRRFTETPITQSRDKYKRYLNFKIVYINRKSLTNGTDFKSCNVCGFYIKNSFHDCFKCLIRNPKKLKLTFNRLKTENFNLKECSQQREDESTPQWKVGYENTIKGLKKTNSLSVQKRRQMGLLIYKLNHKICDYKKTVPYWVASKNYWKKKSKRQTNVIRDNKLYEHGLINTINKQKRTHYVELTQFSKKFESIERKVIEMIYKLNDENFDLKEKIKTLENHCWDPIIIVNTVLNNQQFIEDNQQFIEDNQQISKLNELQVKCKELEQKLLITENELLITKNRLEFNFDLDLPELHLAEHATIDKQDQSVVVKRATKRRLQTEKVSTNQQIFGTKGCKPKFRDIKMRVNHKNEELSKEVFLMDEFIKRLTEPIEKQSPTKLSTKYILVGTHLLIDYKIVMFKESTTYDSELDDRSFSVMHSSIEQLMFCLDKSHQLMITKIDGSVSDHIRQRIQLEEYIPNKGWFDPESNDSSETYIIVHFPDNTTEIWIRMALILLLFKYKPKFIDKREARLILDRAHPSRPIQP